MTSDDSQTESNIEKGRDQKVTRKDADGHKEDRKDLTKPSHQAGYSEPDGVTKRGEANGTENPSMAGTP